MKNIYLLFALLLSYLTVMSQNDKNLLLGKWTNYYNYNNCLIFDGDKFTVVNSNFEYTQEWTLQKNGVFLTQSEFDETPFPYHYYFLDNLMVILTMKPNLDQVDEVSLYTKNNNSSTLVTNQKLKY